MIRVITVRLPEEMHTALKGEAAARETSLNQLCVSKLRELTPDVDAGERDAEKSGDAE